MRIGEEDVKRDTHEEVVAKIRDSASSLKITVVTPVKGWVRNRRIDSPAATPSPSSTVFTPSSSRTSFSSTSSSSSSLSDMSLSKRKKRSLVKIIRK